MQTKEYKIDDLGLVFLYPKATWSVQHTQQDSKVFIISHLQKQKQCAENINLQFLFSTSTIQEQAKQAQEQLKKGTQKCTCSNVQIVATHDGKQACYFDAKYQVSGKKIDQAMWIIDGDYPYRVVFAYTSSIGAPSLKTDVTTILNSFTFTSYSKLPFKSVVHPLQKNITFQVPPLYFEDASKLPHLFFFSPLQVFSGNTVVENVVFQVLPRTKESLQEEFLAQMQRLHNFDEFNVIRENSKLLIDQYEAIHNVCVYKVANKLTTQCTLVILESTDKMLMITANSNAAKQPFLQQHFDHIVASVKLK